MVGNSYSPSPSPRAQEAFDGAQERQDTWDQRKPLRPETVRKAGLLAITAAAAAALLIIPQPDNDPAAEAYALQALAEPSSDGDTQEVTEPTYEVADQSLETNDSASWSALDSEAAAAFELSRFRRQAETAVAPTTTEPSTTTVPPTTQATVGSTTVAPTTESDTTEAAEVETSNEEQSAAPADDATTATEGSETTATTVEETPTTVEETTTTTAPPTTAADNGFVNAGHGVYVPPILLEIRRCESGGNYQAANPSSSARGAYQFLTGSWAGYGHADRYGVSQAHLASNAQQDEAALITWQRDGTRPWNASRYCWG